MRKLNFDKLALWLLVIGGLNWGLTLFKYNLVESIVSATGQEIIGTITYALVGISAILTALKLIK